MMPTPPEQRRRRLPRPPRRSGLTLVEVLIVIVVVAILAMIVVPAAMGAGREARETALRADLHKLRSAIEMFRADMGGHPEKLEHLVRVKAPDECCLPPDGREIECPESNYRGPYLTTPDGLLPVDPITGARDWHYNDDVGSVRSNAQGIAANGTAYSTW
jgi:general secretion pathway protein G